MRRRFSLVLGIVIFAVASLYPHATVQAVDVSRETFLNQLHYNNLITDGDFVAINSLSVGEIQSFLSSKGSYLATAPADQLGEGHRGRSAAQIIWDAAHGKYDAGGTLNGIAINESTGTVSPKAILVTLQKEQSLVTLTDYQARRLNAAMGYGCPDSGGCNPNYAGFTRQVEWASWQLRYNYEIAGRNAGWWQSVYGNQFQYRVGNGKSMAYSFNDPPVSGTVTVTFNNQATASLYRYTPHITYGNYNFWKLSREWFGASTGGGSSGAFNDTSAVELRTYQRLVTVKGSKETDARVVFNGSQIAGGGGTSWSHQFEPTVGRRDYIFEFKDSSGNLIATKTVTVDRRKQGDIEGSGRVDLADLSLISNGWGTTIMGEDWRNLNPEVDNEINLLDLSIFANNWDG